MLVTRKAILIGAPSVKPELPGVVKDINDIKDFLLSNKGGAWRNDEIVILVDKPLAYINYIISLEKNTDYVFITCSGHGEHRVGAQYGLGDTVMYLNENDTIAIDSVNPKNKRHLVVVDVCRTFVRVKNALESFSESARVTLDYAQQTINYRKVFDDAVMLTTEGRIVTYSCEINQAAGDDGNGGVFTQALLDSVGKFRKNNNYLYGIVNIGDAFEVAKSETYRKNSPQSPVLNAGRRRDFFPFAIVT